LGIAWVGGGCAGGSLFAGPRLVSPGEEDEGDFAEDVGSGYVEVVF